MTGEKMIKRYLPAIITTLVVAVFLVIGLAGCKSACGDKPCGGPKHPLKSSMFVR